MVVRVDVLAGVLQVVTGAGPFDLNREPVVALKDGGLSDRQGGRGSELNEFELGKNRNVRDPSVFTVGVWPAGA